MASTSQLLALKDPYTWVYDEVVSQLRTSPHLQKYVAPLNVISMSTDDPRPILEGTQISELPRILVVQATEGIPALSFSSSGLSDTMILNIRLDTGELTYRTNLYPVRWALVKALANLNFDHLPFVVDMHLLSRTTMLDKSTEVDEGTGLVGWVDILPVQFTLVFDRASLEMDPVFSQRPILDASVSVSVEALNE